MRLSVEVIDETTNRRIIYDNIEQIKVLEHGIKLIDTDFYPIYIEKNDFTKIIIGHEYI